MPRLLLFSLKKFCVKLVNEIRLSVFFFEVVDWRVLGMVNYKG